MVAVVGYYIKPPCQFANHNIFLNSQQGSRVVHHLGEVADEVLPYMFLGCEYHPFFADGVEHSGAVAGGAEF